jgi:hypothetical protein
MRPGYLRREGELAAVAFEVHHHRVEFGVFQKIVDVLNEIGVAQRRIGDIHALDVAGSVQLMIR